jgi:hypothetical protein
LPLPNYDSWKSAGAWDDDGPPECVKCDEELVLIDNGHDRGIGCDNPICEKYMEIVRKFRNE